MGLILGLFSICVSIISLLLLIYTTALWAELVGVALLLVSLIASISAIIVGHIALHKIAKYPDKYDGNKRAITGIILGTIFIALWALYVFILAITPNGP